MKTISAGALRLPQGRARPQLSAAQDLVRETLSRHGLWTADAGLPGAGMASGLDWPTARSTPQDDLPPGAEFRAETHEGRSGSRAFRRYVPASARDGVEGVVLMLHGCTQTPEDFARGTGMNALAEAHRLVILYPHQARGANAQSCWNWFSTGDQRRDRGEPEILAGMVRRAMADHDVPADRVFVAGLSAGAAMAVILGETYPDLFAAVGAHSGLPFGAARDVPSAFAAMAGEVVPAPARTRAAGAAQTRAQRTIVIHGDQDRTVHPRNGAEIARRAGSVPGATLIETVDTGQAGGRAYECTRTRDETGRVLAEHWVVSGLGHAWSGGDRAGSYADPAGPVASAEMIRFFLDPTPH
jgi:poly(hydroxyalkanoate) depolymerase family esterase